jgi:hypothetical protein
LIFELQRTIQKEEPTTSYTASPTRSNTTPQIHHKDRVAVDQQILCSKEGGKKQYKTEDKP